MNGWELYYKHWKAEQFDDEIYAWRGARFGDLKPDTRQGCLDTNVLRKHGLNADRMRNDPLFFYQLLFPFCAPSDSGVADDHRMPFIPTFWCLPTCTRCGRLQEAATDMISLQYRFLN
jgi:hypothetical protein